MVCAGVVSCALCSSPIIALVVGCSSPTTHDRICRGFKALKQIVKLQYQLSNTEDMLTAYKCAPWYNSRVTTNKHPWLDAVLCMHPHQ